MSEKPVTTSWLWKAGEGVNGVQIDTDDRMLEWYDDIGCACGDSTAVQSFADFHARGPKFTSIPPEVADEVRASLAALEASES
jgi:hypothetical protein